jgi:hypothetical protein
MLLGHRSGLPNWDSPTIDAIAALDLGRVWQVAEFLDLAAVQKPLFPPGARYAYSKARRLRQDGDVAQRAAASGCRRSVLGACAFVLGCRGGPVSPIQRPPTVIESTTVTVGLNVHARSIRLSTVRADELAGGADAAHEEAVEWLLHRWPGAPRD